MPQAFASTSLIKKTLGVLSTLLNSCASKDQGRLVALHTLSFAGPATPKQAAFTLGIFVSSRNCERREANWENSLLLYLFVVMHFSFS